MSPFALIPAEYRFAAQLLAILALGIALMVGIYRITAYYEAIGYDRASAICTADKLTAERANALRENQINHQIRKAQTDAEARQKSLAADIASLTVQLDRMRHDREAMRSRIATLSAPAARTVASAAIDIYTDCAEKYGSLAKDADQCLSERQTLIDAWPK